MSDSHRHPLNLSDNNLCIPLSLIFKNIINNYSMWNLTEDVNYVMDSQRYPLNLFLITDD